MNNLYLAPQIPDWIIAILLAIVCAAMLIVALLIVASIIFWSLEDKYDSIMEDGD